MEEKISKTFNFTLKFDNINYQYFKLFQLFDLN